MRDMVVLIDLDGTACRSMARKLRAEHMYCKILPADSSAADVAAQETLGLLLAGGDSGEAAFIPHLEELMACGLPLMAMGDAALTVVTALGGTLGAKAAEPGVCQVHYEGDEQLFSQVEDGERFLRARRVMNLPEGATAIARTDEGVLGFRAADRPVYGLAFLPEQNDPDGVQLLINFCKTICGCTLWWSNQAFVERAREEIERVTDGGEAICALSGGVDSGVCALLGNMALGHRLHCVFVDTGLLRKDEGDKVMAFYRDQIGLNLTRVNAQEEILSALRGVTKPAEKEKIIFDRLKAVLQAEMARMPGVRVILQGTNYSDSLQTGTLFPLEKPDDQVRLVEPVRELFKDEIRLVGEELGLPSAVVQRQPFPGSGLALRILADVTQERLAVLREADAIFRAELEESGQNKRLWQYFATLADNPADPGSSYVVALRAVQVADGAAAVASRLPYDLLEHVTKLIRERTPQVQRVLYDLTPSSNYSHVEWR